jgi:uncharacterized protein GlcG (DUF336 family)
MGVTSADAQALVSNALSRARDLGATVSVAVLDDHGFLMAFGRADGARPYTTEVALGKAYGVVFMGRPSAELRELADARPRFFDAIKNLGMRTLIPSPGGIAIDGGAIGVSGASNPEQDVEIAEAAVRALGP